MSINDIKLVIQENQRHLSIIVTSVTFISIFYCYFIATPYFKSESSFYQKKTGGSLSGMSSSFGKLVEKQLGLGANDKNFNIYIPDLIYNSDKILMSIINSKFETSISKEPLSLSEFWDFESIVNKDERKFLLKEKLRKSINIGINEESKLITMSCETEDRILSKMIMDNLIKEIRNFIKTSTSEHYKDLKFNIGNKVDKYKNDYNKAFEDLKIHLNKYDVAEQKQTNIEIITKKLNDEVLIQRELYLAQRLDFEKAENLEKDNTETLLMIQEPTQPIKQSWPRSLLIIALSFVSSLFGAIYFFVLKRKFG